MHKLLNAHRANPFFCLLGPHLWHMEVPRLGAESELQLLAYTIAMPDLRFVSDLHHSSWQCQILNPLNKYRDRTCNSWIVVRLVTNEPGWELPEDQFINLHRFHLFCPDFSHWASSL